MEGEEYTIGKSRRKSRSTDRISIKREELGGVNVSSSREMGGGRRYKKKTKDSMQTNQEGAINLSDKR